MAHYAYIDKDTSKVVAVTVGKDETESIDDMDTETYYAQGTPYIVKRTSYNAATNGFRKHFAGIGYTYDAQFDAFIPPRIFESWKLNYTTFLWEPPIACPEEIKRHIWKWSEYNKEWISVPL